jgi:hypothetical protein
MSLISTCWAFDVDEVVGAQPSQRAVDVRQAEAEYVAHQFLGQRHPIGAFIGKTDRLQPDKQLKQEMRNPLERRPPSDIDQVLGIHRRLARKRAEHDRRQPWMMLEQCEEVGKRNRCHEGIAQRGDRVKRRLEKACRKADDIAGKDDVEYLPTAVV